MKMGVFLHDPPEKCTDIGGHEGAAETNRTVFGLDNNALAGVNAEMNEVVRLADHCAASVDRFVFPQRKCSSRFTGKPGEAFRHPLCSEEYVPEKSSLESTERYHAILSAAFGGIPEDLPLQGKFFCLWRFWCENAMDNQNFPSPEVALFPADTRIPDHTIWNHIAIASAFAGTYDSTSGRLKPALLMFQLGPVQEFIAQARSTRDLWSGSYLLSWLIAHALKAISDAIGPDAVIFPNLRGNGIFDALHREEVYEKSHYSNGDGTSDSLWDRLRKNEDFDKRLVTPTLPNRFLALVPEERVEELARLAEKAIRDELKKIGEAVWKWFAQEARQAEWENPETKAKCKVSEAEITSWKARWNRQVEAFLQLSWAWQPWLEREECLEAFGKLPVNRKSDGNTPYGTLETFLKLSEEWLKEECRDERFYED